MILNDLIVVCLCGLSTLFGKSFKLLKQWGFTYKTIAFTWAKKNKTNDNFLWD